MRKGNKKYKLRTKLTMSYLLIGLLCIIAITLVSNSFLERSFIRYVVRNQEIKNLGLVEQIVNHVDQNERWNTDWIASIGISALEQGMLLRVEKSSGEVVWDAYTHNSGMCEEMISHMALQMVDKVPSWEGEFTNTAYSLEREGRVFGKAVIGYYGPYYYSDTDAAFLDTLNHLLMIISLMTVCLALIVGAFMAKKISWPLSRVTEIADEISKGNYEARVEIRSNTAEIDTLISAVDDLAQTLEKQEQMRQKLTTDVAHELRTPLATLQSHMEAMIDGIWKPDVDRLMSCHDEIVRLSGLVGDLEKLAQYESEAANGVYEPFELSQCIEAQIKHFENAYHKKNMQISFEKGEDMLVNGNKNQISQVVINLLSNALKYSHEGDTVIVRTFVKQNRACFSVEDFGEGISEAHLPHIFERFYRADPSRSRITGGAGIGLAITKAIVTSHHGKIEAACIREKGTTFTVELPIYKGRG